MPRMRRLVIQKGEPFAILDDGRIQTTTEGLRLLKTFLANPPSLPKRYEEKIASLSLLRNELLPISSRTFVHKSHSQSVQPLSLQQA